MKRFISISKVSSSIKVDLGCLTYYLIVYVFRFIGYRIPAVASSIQIGH